MRLNHLNSIFCLHAFVFLVRITLIVLANIEQRASRNEIGAIMQNMLFCIYHTLALIQQQQPNGTHIQKRLHDEAVLTFPTTTFALSRHFDAIFCDAARSMFHVLCFDRKVFSLSTDSPFYSALIYIKNAFNFFSAHILIYLFSNQVEVVTHCKLMFDLYNWSKKLKWWRKTLIRSLHLLNTILSIIKFVY